MANTPTPAPSQPKKDRGTSTDPSVAQILHLALIEDQDTQQFSDFVVKVEDVEFKCHRFLLSTRSGFFRSLLASSMKEMAEGKVSLQRMTSKVFAVVLKWMYEGDTSLNKENVFEVLFAADLLDIPCLANACKQLLANTLSLDNCVSIHHTGKALNDDNLKSRSFKFMLQEFDRVCATEEFYKLDAEDLKALVSDSGLKTRSEDVVVENILKWVHAEACSYKHETIERVVGTEVQRRVDESDKSAELLNLPEPEGTATSTHSFFSITGQDKATEKPFLDSDPQDKDEPSSGQILAEMLEATRYLLLSGNCLWQTLACDPLVKSDPRCQRLVEEIVCYNIRLDIHQDALRTPAKRRLSDQLVNVVLTSVDNTFLYSRGNSDFVTIDLKCPATTIQGLVYFENGIYLRNEKSEVFVYTPRYQKWDKVATKERMTKTLAMMPVGNELIAITTVDSQTYAVENMSLKAHGPATWDQVGEFLTQGLEIASVTNIGSKVIVFWRQAGENCLKIECFDLVHRESALLPDQLGSTSRLVTFKHKDDAFAVQEDGSLWRICVGKSDHRITIKREICLWNFNRPVDGAMLVGDALVIFETAKEPTEPLQPPPERVCLDKVFTSVKFIKSKPTRTGYIHAFLRRKIQCLSQQQE